MDSKHMAGSVVRVMIKITVVAVVVFFVYKGASAAYDYGYRIFAEPAMAPAGSGRIVSVAITEGKSVKEVGEILESKGLIRDPQLFYIQYLTSKFNKKDIVPGAYELSTELTAEQILAVITVVPEIPEEDMNIGSDEPKEEDTGEDDANEDEQEAETGGE